MEPKNLDHLGAEFLEPVLNVSPPYLYIEGGFESTFTKYLSQGLAIQLTSFLGLQ